MVFVPFSNGSYAQTMMWYTTLGYRISSNRMCVLHSFQRFDSAHFMRGRPVFPSWEILRRIFPELAMIFQTGSGNSPEKSCSLQSQHWVSKLASYSTSVTSLRASHHLLDQGPCKMRTLFKGALYFTHIWPRESMCAFYLRKYGISITDCVWCIYLWYRRNFRTFIAKRDLEINSSPNLSG